MSSRKNASTYPETSRGISSATAGGVLDQQPWERDAFTEGRPIREIRPLKTHNHLLGDRKALEKAWHSDGYWFFRDVLDKGAIGRFRDSYIGELDRLGVVSCDPAERTEAGVRYNGADLTNFPNRMEGLARHKPWKAFVSETPIHEFFSYLLADEPVWIPVVHYRATPPTPHRVASRFAGIHADGPFNPGLFFRICWIPLVEINDEIGGIVVAEGMAAEKKSYQPEENGQLKFIPYENIPKKAWRRADYHVGDLLMINQWTPHCGLSNLTENWRLSLDIRVESRTENTNIIGEVKTISVDRIEIETQSGLVSLKIDDQTYARDRSGNRLVGEAMVEHYFPGKEVLAVKIGDKASVLRPQT